MICHKCDSPASRIVKYNEQISNAWCSECWEDDIKLKDLMATNKDTSIHELIMHSNAENRKNEMTTLDDIFKYLMERDNDKEEPSKWNCCERCG